MTQIVRIALGLAVALTLASPVRAQSTVNVTVLSPEDVKLYGEIFQAEKSGQLKRADTLATKLEDKVLIGYALMERYLGPHYKTSFNELKAWLEEYSDLSGAPRVYQLAVKRAPKGARVPPPARIHWRGVAGEGDAFGETGLQSQQARSAATQIRRFDREGRPEASEALVKKLSPGPSLPRADYDRLSAHVAQDYLSHAKAEKALDLAQRCVMRGSLSADECHWIGGLAAYRLGQFEVAARHFETLSEITGNAARTDAGAAFWAARSWMRANAPERVLGLYTRAAADQDTFYGLLAARVLGRDTSVAFEDAKLDTVSFAALMREPSAHRAVALWQIGHREDLAEELGRAFGEIDPDLDPAFAALARDLGVPTLELRAAETSSERAIHLTSLYPVPPFKPRDGYDVDQALVLAFAKQESRFEPSAVSRAGARGVMQIMPATAAIITHDRTLAGANKKRLDDPTYSMTLGQSYLRDILERQNGSLVGLAAAYNAGEGNLMKWMTLHDGVSDPLLFIESVPNPETRDYIKRVLMNMWMYRTRLGQEADGLDEAAAGDWPVYKQAAPTPAK
jgi:soluble lytic murein transglycosylase-like protein